MIAAAMTMNLRMVYEGNVVYLFIFIRYMARHVTPDDTL